MFQMLSLSIDVYIYEFHISQGSRQSLLFTKDSRINLKIVVRFNAERFSFRCFCWRRYGWMAALSRWKIGKVLSQPDLLLTIYGQNI